jgi:trk system potassium uptake protein TrkH
MNLRCVLHVVSVLMLVVAAAMATAALASWGWGDSPAVIYAMLRASGMGALLGALLFVVTRGPISLTRKDGFGIVALGWIAAGLIGALPYLLTGAIPNPVDAVFETISGFTTTGATILTDIEVLPRGIIYWRSLTQWLGGMGVLLVVVAILPILGVGGMQIYRAEMPGPQKDRLTPRIGNTAKLLYGVYLLLTVVQTVLLMAAGMSFFDALNHTFCTVSTGGFSPYNASVAAFESSWIHNIIIVFMILAGINFSLHFRFLRGEFQTYFKSAETKFYLGLVFATALAITVSLSADLTPGIRLRDSLFQVTSIITTTGFATADFDLWPLFPKAILFALLFSGGCAGSTAGGLKIVRSLVLLKEVFRQLKLFIQPQAVLKVRLDKFPVPSTIVSGITAFMFCYLLLITIFTLLMTFYLPDFASASSAAISCLGNVGPGFSAVGPTRNYAAIADSGKLLLAFCMLLGRLELFTVLVLFTPSLWKR